MMKSVVIAALFSAAVMTAFIPLPQVDASTALSAEPSFRHRALQQKNADPYFKPEPNYAKWGKLAVSETKKRYPNAHVMDYLHVGRSRKSASLVQETFKLWLKSESREFGVLVTIVFNQTTEQVTSIQFCETNR